MKLLATLAAATAVATPLGYVQSQQRDDGGFGDPQLTAWATLGLVAAGADTGRAVEYLARQEPEAATDAALVAMARAAAGDRPDDLLPRLRAHRPGKLVNATIWTILALRQAGEPVPRPLVQALLGAQRPSGGWSWLAGGAADSNDTAAALQALRAAGVHGKRDRPRGRVPPPPPEPGRWLRADTRPGLRHPVDRVGDPGPARRRPVPRSAGVPLPRAHAPARRQLPLQRALRDDAALGHRAGAARARAQAVPAG